MRQEDSEEVEAQARPPVVVALLLLGVTAVLGCSFVVVIEHGCFLVESGGTSMLVCVGGPVLRPSAVVVVGWLRSL